MKYIFILLIVLGSYCSVKAQEPISRENSSAELNAILDQGAAKPTCIPQDICLKPDQLAEFPGGEKALYQWLKGNIKKPAGANIPDNARSVIRVVIEKDGHAAWAEILKSGDALLDQQALEAIKKMPAWKPARKNNEPVRSFFVIPVNF